MEKASRVGAWYPWTATSPPEPSLQPSELGCISRWALGEVAAGWARGRYLYVRPDLLAKFEPAITGWSAHAHPFDFKIGPSAYADGIMRWMHGTPPWRRCISAGPGYRMIAQVGVERIRAKSMRQTARIIEKGARPECGSTPDSRRAAWRQRRDRRARGPAGLPGADRRGFIGIIGRGAGVRVAPQLYTSERRV